MYYLYTSEDKDYANMYVSLRKRDQYRKKPIVPVGIINDGMILNILRSKVNLMPIVDEEDDMDDIKRLFDFLRKRRWVLVKRQVSECKSKSKSSRKKGK